MGQANQNKFVFIAHIPIQLSGIMSHADDEVVVKPKTRKLFEKLKNIAKIFEAIDDIDELAMKVSKRKRAGEVSTIDSESERKTRRKDQSADSERSIESTPQQRNSKHTNSKHKKRNKKIKRNAARKRQIRHSENSSSDTSTASSSYASTDDDIVNDELRKIIGDPISHYKPLDYKFSATRIEKDIRAVAPDNIDFPTADPTSKWEGYDEEDAAESVILSAATSRSILLMANVTAESPETWQKLKNPIMRTFRLSQQTTTHAQAARESLVLNEKDKYLKAATPPPGVIRDSVLKNLKKRSESTQSLFAGGGGVAGLPSREAGDAESIRTSRRTPEQLNGREISRSRRETNEVPGSMECNWSRKTGDDGNNASMDKRKQQMNPQKHITSHTTQRKPASISSSSLRRNPDGSYRKILDARAINEQTKKIHFKMISPSDIQQAFLKNSYLNSIDIKSAFNYITVHPSLQRYLGFQVENRSYVYISMPFGIRFAQTVFTKTIQMALAAIKKEIRDGTNQRNTLSGMDLEYGRNNSQDALRLTDQATVPIEPPHSLDSITTGNTDQITSKINWKATVPQIPISTVIILSNQVESLKGQNCSQARMGFDSSTQTYNLIRALLVVLDNNTKQSIVTIEENTGDSHSDNRCQQNWIESGTEAGLIRITTNLDMEETNESQIQQPEGSESNSPRAEKVQTVTCRHRSIDGSGGQLSCCYEPLTESICSPTRYNNETNLPRSKANGIDVACSTFQGSGQQVR
ncbi:MAG: hypothetical protein EZS28_015774 [Streblomastix strix]|uniref:Reverse transcriptase domain-containing protein n=1 Tax=Streblomastix strix TaxID=222440 RepID=A0A5J4W2G0_9EUKA|nr:MAG: hypothetical protein EZS28_015774 [Streblomastix strix]